MNLPENEDGIHWLTAAETVHRIAAGSVTASTMLEACLARIGRREQQIHAWEFLDVELARESVQVLKHGPLHGVPVGVKDVFDTFDQPTAYGYPPYKGSRPRRDAAVVARLREAGALVLGKTVTTEFAYKHPSVTRNPHDPLHTPAGSSSGSAAAVADGMVPIAIGTQTGGSVIRPAAYCGVVGYKPSFGWIPRAGCFILSETIDTPGMFARTIEDVGTLGEILSDRDLRMQATNGTPVLGLDRTVEWEELESSARNVIEEAVENLRASGATVVELEVVDRERVLEAQATILAYESARSLAHERLVEHAHLSEVLQDRISHGATISGAAYDEALRVAAEARAAANRVLATVQAVLTPSAPGPAPRGLSSIGSATFNSLWTFLGVPCLHLPLDLDETGLPLGVQFCATWSGDKGLLAAARWAARALEALPLPRPVSSERG